MDILWALLTLPYAPVRGLAAVVRVIAREAESRQHNPVTTRRELEELDRAAEAGEISPQERDRAQQRVLERLTPPPGGLGAGPSAESPPVRGPAPARRAAPVRRRVTGGPGRRGRGR